MNSFITIDLYTSLFLTLSLTLTKWSCQVVLICILHLHFFYSDVSNDKIFNDKFLFFCFLMWFLHSHIRLLHFLGTIWQFICNLQQHIFKWFHIWKIHARPINKSVKFLNLKAQLRGRNWLGSMAMTGRVVKTKKFFSHFWKRLSFWFKLIIDLPK